MNRNENFIQIGKIVKPFGLKGEVQVFFYNPGWENLPSFKILFFKKEGNFREFEIERIRASGSKTILKFKDCPDRNSAEAICGEGLYLPDTALAKCDKDEFYYYKIIGFKVLSREKEILGEVTKILDIGPYDLFVIKNGSREIMLPSVKEMIAEISDSQKSIILTDQGMVTIKNL